MTCLHPVPGNPGVPGDPGLCQNLTGIYTSNETSHQLVLSQKDGILEGLYRLDNILIPIWLEVFGTKGEGESESYGFTLSSYGKSSIILLTGKYMPEFLESDHALP